MIKEYKPLLDIIEILSDMILLEKCKENSRLSVSSLVEIRSSNNSNHRK